MDVDRRSFIKALAAGSVVGLAATGTANFAARPASGAAPVGQSQTPAGSSSGGKFPYSYLVYRDSSSGLYDAVNGMTGTVDYSGSNAATVLQSAVNNAPMGGSIFVHVGTFSGSGAVTNTRGLSIIAQGGTVFSGFTMPCFARMASIVTRHFTLTPEGPYDGGDFGPNTS